MDLIRDLLRDLVGIIFPGGLFVIFSVWLIICLLIILVPIDILTVFSFADKSTGLLVLLIFSYIAGQSIRIRRLEDLEKTCTETYRKKKIKEKPELSKEEFQESIKALDRLDEEYYAGKLNPDIIMEAYRQHNNKFGVWEEFPYPYLMRGGRLLRQPRDYSQFFEKYEKQGITKYQYFFNFCKTVIYEYSPSLKEELIRQEALVRLFAGIYYMMKYGKIIGIVTGLSHSGVILAFYLIRISFPVSISFSWGILIMSVLALLAFWYLNREIMDRLRLMRSKELNLTFDGFYVISNRYKLNFGQVDQLNGAG